MIHLSYEREGLAVVRLYLEKLELLTEKERSVLLETIDWLNHPILINEEKP